MSGPYGPAAYSFPEEPPFTGPATREQELDLLKSEAEAIKGQLEQIEARMRELETGN